MNSAINVELALNFTFYDNYRLNSKSLKHTSKTK